MAPIAIDPEPVAAAPAHPLKAAAAPKQDLSKLAANPLSRTYRGNKAGTIHMEGIPEFADPLEKREWVKVQLAAAFQYWGKLGYGEGLSGHITCRDPVWPDHYWMNPIGVHFSSVKVSNLCLVTPEGYVHDTIGAQLAINHAGFIIHSAIHKARPEVQAIGHCHSLHGKAWSVFGRPIDILTQDACLYYDNLAVYKNFGGIVLAPEEGKNIAEALGPKSMAAILQNHGLLTLGSTIGECAYYFSNLDRLCKVQLMVEAAAANGIKKVVIDDVDAAFTAATLQNPHNVFANWRPELELLIEERGHFFLK
ncbi:uncharacterized protein JCM10292_006221 [Rhodotorula paludigena]|uniref:uncharacterized protein n=1 Tax=Rhodotorula paludigena TaxID=86838 RepID=UPI00317FEB23